MEVTGPLAPALLATCGAAVTDVLIEDGFEGGTGVVVLDEDGTELVWLEEDGNEDVEAVMLEFVAELMDSEDANVLGSARLVVVLEDALFISGDCVDTEGSNVDTAVDEEFGKNAGSKAMENAFAGQAQTQLHA